MSKTHDEYERWLHDTDEKIEYVLGDAHANSSWSAFLGMSKAVLVLTDKRLYQKGRSFDTGGNGQGSFRTSQQTVAVKDITSVRHECLDTRIQAAGPAVAGIALLVFGLQVEGACCFEDLLVLGGVISILMALLLAFDGKKSLLAIHYAGGSISVDLDWYPADDVERFQREVSRLQDQVVGDGASAPD